jgi:hypothetical protein
MSFGSISNLGSGRFKMDPVCSVDRSPTVVHFFDADGLPGEDRAEVDFFLAKQMRPQSQ